MNIYLFELKQNKKLAISWAIAIISIVLFVSMFFPMFSKEMKEFLKIIDNLPPLFKESFGMNPDTIGSILGYYSFILTFVLICGAIEACYLGLSILTKEQRDKTADFLLSKPVSRTKIVTSKILSSLTLILISNILYFIIFYLILNSFTNIEFNFKIYSLLTLSILFIQLLFFFIGMFISTLFKKIKSVTSISLGLSFGLYLLSMFVKDDLKLIAPFKYFDVSKILLTGTFESKYIIISIIIIIISISLTYIIYNKKDIHPVI